MRVVPAVSFVAALLGTDVAAAADIPGNASTKAVIVAGATQVGAPDTTVFGTFDKTDDHDWYRLKVVKGETYAVYGYGGDLDVNGAQLNAYNGASKVIAKGFNLGDPTYLAFTAAYSGPVFVDIFLPGTVTPGAEGYQLRATLDCAGVYKLTTCSTMTNAPRHGYSNYPTDHDFYKVGLLQGRTYSIALDDPRCAVDIRVVDRQGRVVLRPTGNQTLRSLTVRYTAAYSGPFYVDLVATTDNGREDGCGDYNYSIRKLF